MGGLEGEWAVFMSCVLPSRISTEKNNKVLTDFILNSDQDVPVPDTSQLVGSTLFEIAHDLQIFDAPTITVVPCAVHQAPRFNKWHAGYKCTLV